MTRTNEKQQPGGEPSGQDLVEQLKASGQLDVLWERDEDLLLAST